ncbi:MAG: hypothetical protein Fur0026_10240 [Sideroxydans sp.]
MLSKMSPQAFDTLYQTISESRLYSIQPCWEHAIPENETFALQITLFGIGTDFALAVSQAVTELGKSGLRPGGHYEVVAVRSIAPDGEVEIFSREQGFVTLPQAHDMQAWLGAGREVIERCEVRFITPLRIKEGNDLLRTAPGYAQLMRRIMGRVDQIAHAAQAATPLAKTERAELFGEADAVEIESARIIPYAIERRSARSGQQMQFEGLTGSLVYRGKMRFTLPWLRLASLVQVGGKTSFGFGGTALNTEPLDTEA